MRLCKFCEYSNLSHLVATESSPSSNPFAIPGGASIVSPAARIATSVPTGKGGVNGISAGDITPFTTRPRCGRMFEIRPTPARSRTTEYTRDCRCLDRGVAGGGFDSTGFERPNPTRSRSVRSIAFKVGGSGWRWPPGGMAVDPRPQGGVRCCLANLDMCARSDALDAGRIWPTWSAWRRAT